MNKKLIYGLMLPLFAVMLVSAGIIYYTTFNSTFTVNSAIEVEGELKQSLGEVISGESITGSEIILTNIAPSERTLVISDDGESKDVRVSYIGKLELTKKEVDFTKDVWKVLDGDINKAQVEYTIVGNEFSARTDKTTLESYVLIYYPDNDDRFVNPSEAWTIDYLTGMNLPVVWDWNYGSPYDEDYDYCKTGEYLTCHGAKIWYVPISAINDDDTLDWSRASEFYFETELIQYNSEGNIIIYPGSSLTIIPEYTPDNYVAGEVSITTTIA